MRPFLIALHKYLGLFLGLLLSLIGITGSVLVFDHALDEVLAPETVAFDSTLEWVPLQQVLDSARAVVPGNPAPQRIYLARKEGSPHVVRFPGPPGAPGPVEVSVAPGTGEVLARRNWGEYPVSWIYRLHYTLLAGNTGKTVVGVAGILLLFFAISGVIIWWPRKGRWRRALTIQKNAGSYRLNYDLHKTAGIYLLPVLVVVAFSGVSLVFHSPVEALVRSIATVEQRPGPRSSGAGPIIDADRAVAIGQKVFPAGVLKRVFLPQGAEGAYHLAFNLPGEPWTQHAVSAVWVDQYNGEVLATWDATRLAAGSKFLAWQFPLHNGDALGMPGRLLVMVCGLLPALFFATGLYMWLRKRQGRKATLAMRSAATRT